nr:LLM class flavin-dependent oxidoreductase [Nocardioides sambongensis]
MDLGIHYANFSHPDWSDRLVDRLTGTARLADAGGIRQLSVMDHYFQMEMLGGPEEPMLEGYTTLGYLAAVTERLDLGLLVTGVSYRHPGLLAKIVTTLDVLSGAGRSSASAPRGTTGSTKGWECPSRRPRSASNGSRRRCGSSGR